MHCSLRLAGFGQRRSELKIKLRADLASLGNRPLKLWNAFDQIRALLHLSRREIKLRIGPGQRLRIIYGDESAEGVFLFLLLLGEWGEQIAPRLLALNEMV